MDALILAGGLGTRLRSMVREVPKVMAPVGGKPFLSHIISQLREQGFIHICLGVGYLAHIIIEYFKDGSEFGISIEYSVETRPLGTGGAIKKAAKTLSSDFLVFNGDSYFDINFIDLINFHFKKKSSITMALIDYQDKTRYGLVKLNDDNQVISLNEKPTINELCLINAGIYVIDKRALDQSLNKMPLSFETEILPRFINNGLFGLAMEGFFIDIGVPSSYQLVRNGLPSKKFKL